MRQYTGLCKYIMVKNGKVFDTTFLFPHTECYFIEDDKFYFETTDGIENYLGHIIAQSNDLSDLEDLARKFEEAN